MKFPEKTEGDVENILVCFSMADVREYFKCERAKENFLSGRKNDMPRIEEREIFNFGHIEVEFGIFISKSNFSKLLAMQFLGKYMNKKTICFTKKQNLSSSMV